MKKISIAILFILNTACLYSQVNWLTLEEADKKSEELKKPIYIDMYTPWCGYCKKMDASTFADPGIANYLNANFYPVKLNAEGGDTIVYKGKTYTNPLYNHPQYTNSSRKPTHEVVSQINTDGRLSYPTSYVIDKNGTISKAPGYLEPKDFQALLVYFAEEMNTSTNYQEFKAYFDAIYINKDTSYSLENVNWVSLEEALKEKKKILLYFTGNYSVGGTLMEHVFNDSTLSSYINDKFIPVKFDVQSTDTLNVFENTFVNNLEEHPFHNFPVAILEGKMKLPSYVIFDEEHKLIDKIQIYLTPKNVEPILHFYGDEAYKTIKYSEYRTNFASQIP